MSFVSMVVLAYNDGPSLPALLRGVSSVLQSCADDHEIIVVDDGSSDRTAAIVEELSEKIDRLRLLRHGRNRGVGAAFRSGVMAARGDVIGYIDGDGQYDPLDIPPLLARLQVVDAVAGLRHHRADPLHRRLISHCYNGLIRTLFGLSVQDVNSGLKLFRRRFLEVGTPLEADSPFFDAELLIKGTAAGGSFEELPVKHLPRLHGHASGGSLRSIWTTLRELRSSRIRRGLRQSRKPWSG